MAPFVVPGFLAGDADGAVSFRLRVAAMTVSALLRDAFDRVQQGVHALLEGIDDRALFHRPDAEANTVAWLVWHLARVQDDHVAAAAEAPQRWVEGAWLERFALPFPPSATGYGQGPEEVGAVRATPALLRGYYDEVHAATAAFLDGLGDGDLGRVVDDRWDPPVTLGVRLVSVVSDDLQHVGQAAYLRGLSERAGQ